MRRIGLSLFIALFCASTALAKFLDLNEQIQGASPHGDLHYISPNETYPQFASSITSEAGEGVYLSVGTERGFMGAIQTPRATHLLLADMDPEIVRFNRINIALLQLSQNREDYLKLRLAGQSKLWKEHAGFSQIEEYLKPVLNEENFKWWQKNMESMEGRNMVYPRGFHLKEDPSFKGVNYLFNDKAFHRIQRLAKEGKIQAEVVQAFDRIRMQEVANELTNKKLKISVFDFSNAYDTSDYPTKPENLAGIFKDFRKVSDRDSVLLLSVLSSGSFFGYRWRRFASTPEKELALGKLIVDPHDYGKKFAYGAPDPRVELARELGLPYQYSPVKRKESIHTASFGWPPVGSLDHVLLYQIRRTGGNCIKSLWKIGGE